MKTFKELIAEVAQPLSQGEKNFKALHTIDHKNLVPGVTDQEHVFKGNARREDPATASYENFRDDDESVEAYDKGLQVNPSAPERDIDEETSMNEGLGSSTIKHKQKLSHMDDKAFAAHADSAGWKEKDLRAMAWRHGFGKPGTAGHEHYVKRYNKGLNEEFEQIEEKVKTTYEDPLVTVHDKDGLHTHANLSTANKIFNTKVKHTDVHAGPVKTKDGHETKNNLTFAISKHHASAMKEEVELEEAIKKSGLDKHFEKQSKKMQDAINMHLRQGKDYPTAFAAAKKHVKEDVELDEKTLTPAEMKKREEIAKAMERENPGMPMAKKMAIATAQAKKVAEETIEEKLTDDAKARIQKALGPKTSNNLARKGTDVTKTLITVAKMNPKNIKEEEAILEQDEYDYEGEMARAELNAICDKAGVLAEMLEDDTQLEAWLQSKITKAKYMIDSVYDYMIYSNKSNEDKPMPASTSDYSQAGNMAANYDSFLNRMGEETELDEARRGRPRKDGTSSNEEEGGREHIIVQLRKANNLRGERQTEFNDNTKHKLTLNHVKKALDMHSTMKPQQKAEFEARLAKSHASFHDAVAGKPAEPAKPKVTLAKSAAHMKEALADPSSMRSDRGDVKPVTVMGKGGRLEVIKRQSARKEINVGEAVEMNTANVKKAVKHDCAKHVEHAEWGVGQCITGEHTIVETSEGSGYVSHYDVMFEHGIERDVPVQALNILVSETHEHTRKMSEELKGDQHKIDANKNGKVDAHDFKILRGKTKFTAKLNFKKTRPAFKEEAEQIDELSKATVKSYYNKGREQGMAIQDRMKIGGGDWTADGSDTNTLRKRTAGHQMALRRRRGDVKMSEESGLDETVKVNMQQDSVDKIKKDPLASKETLKLPPTQGNQPIGGEGEIAKGIVEELLNRLYESLSEDNKKIFEQKYQTEEGKLELLAFAEEQGL